MSEYSSQILSSNSYRYMYHCLPADCKLLSKMKHHKKTAMKC